VLCCFLYTTFLKERSMLPQTRFGCRLFAYASNSPSKEVIQQALHENPRSLVQQSQSMFPLPYVAPSTKGSASPAEPINELDLHHEEGLNPEVSKWVNQDGVGIYFNGQQMLSADANKHAGAAIDVLKPEETNTWLNFKQPFKAVLAHIRATTAGVTNLANTQPFHHGNLVFAHNGDLGRQIFNGSYRSRITSIMPGFDLGVEPSDSKLLFGTLLSELQLRYNTADPDKLTPDQLQQTLFDVCDHGTSLNPLDIVSLDPEVTNIPVHGEMDWSRASNFILSAGDDMYAYRRHLSLVFAPILDEKGNVTQTLIQSEATRNMKTIKGEPLAWYTVPDEHMLHVHTNKDGQQYIELVPFARLNAKSTPLHLLNQKLNTLNIAA
jgi:Glutamine amidotransferases class-II